MYSLSLWHCILTQNALDKELIRRKSATKNSERSIKIWVIARPCVCVSKRLSGTGSN